MRAPKAVYLIALSLLSAALAWLGPNHVAPLRVAATWLDDVRIAYLSAPRPLNPDVVVLTINEDTLGLFPFRSPVDRGYIASLVTGLGERNVRAVGLDLIFDQATLAEDDRRLLEAVDAFSAPVVIATGDEENGLTPDQLEFQRQYLDGRRTGSAGLLSTDGVVRHIYPGRVVDGELEPSFTAALARSIGLAVPETPELLHFRARTESGAAPIRSFPSQSLSLLPADWFADAVVIVGADLPSQDRFRTPLSVLGGDYASMPGARVHAQALTQLMEGGEYPALGDWAVLAILLAAALIGLGLPFVKLHLALKVLAGAALLGGYWWLGFYAFEQSETLLPLVPPTLAFLLSASFASAYGRYAERREKKFVRKAFGRYVSPAVIDAILKNPDKLTLGGEQREMSYVFTDLAGFTSLTESLEPAAVVALLQEYFDGLLTLALEFDGTVDRLVGDGANVIFGAPADQTDHARRAVRCALEADRYCEAFRQTQLARGVGFGITRIGVHTGVGIAGNVGSAERFQYTAHGDAVNVAARLESANKQFGTRVCISAASAAYCDDLTFRPIGHIVVRGKSRGVDCVTPWDGLAEAAAQEYQQAFALMQSGDVSALELWQRLKQKYPADPLIAFHIGRLARGEAGTTIVME